MNTVLQSIKHISEVLFIILGFLYLVSSLLLQTTKWVLPTDIIGSMHIFLYIPLVMVILVFITTTMVTSLKPKSPVQEHEEQTALSNKQKTVLIVSSVLSFLLTIWLILL